LKKCKAGLNFKMCESGIIPYNIQNIFTAPWSDALDGA
jgi:hypothetical protein